MRTFADGGQNFFALLDRLHLLKHVSHAHQVVVKDVFGHVKKPEQSRVGDGVIHIAPGFASDHEVAHPQNCKLLRNVRRFNFQNFAELVDPLLAVTEAIEDADADRVGEGLEELRLEVGKLVWHAHPHFHAYCNLRSFLCQVLLSDRGLFLAEGTALTELAETGDGIASGAARSRRQLSGRPKFSAFRPWVQPSLSKKNNGDSLRPRSLPIDEEERQANLKLAVFFAVVALLFALAEHLGHVQERKDANLGADSTALVSLTLSPPQRSGNRAGFSVRFRLSNGGNHSIFYPVRTEINMPIV